MWKLQEKGQRKPKKKDPGGCRDPGKERGESKLLDFFQAAFADHPVPVLGQFAAASAEGTVRFILAKDHGVAVHHNFKHILCVDVQAAAQLNGEHDAAERVQLTDDPCGSHGKNLLFRNEVLVVL